MKVLRYIKRIFRTVPKNAEEICKQGRVGTYEDFIAKKRIVQLFKSI